MYEPIGALIGTFGMGRTDTDFDAPLSVRVSQTTIDELNALEAYLQGLGFREASRSALIREALTTYLDGVRSEAPEALIPAAQRRAGAR